MNKKSAHAAPVKNIEKISFSKEIRKTGFVLENGVAQKFKAAGWTVISNKYYVDDSEETVREIDLIIYRCAKVKHFDVYTVLIISCKKSEENVWAFLTREINLKDPNSDWWPLHAWSNDKAIAYQLSRPTKGADYHKKLKELGVNKVLDDPTVDVFAYQEMNKINGRPQNDKAIFSAITSLMKAQSYELDSLPARKKSPSVYQFNLLSVVETDLVRLMFSGEDIVESALETEHYLTRYILKKRETFSRIRFIQSSALEDTLGDYGQLHSANCKWFAEEIDSFYLNLVQDSARAAVFEPDFNQQIEFWMEVALHKKISDIGPVTINWTKELNAVWLGVLVSEQEIKELNENQRLVARAAALLKSIYRYEGKFSFAEDLPF
ncbi:MAG: hypothetical protein I8H79_22885 [Burkholderiales bacterium]|nr:hypothetical protein [Burkholderiales bacterium]MBH1996194.1 hypothetical protein [Burkholderiales bacterium]MBH2070356.1 hypothetical protein [Burkholderiales bacterium]